MANFFLDYFKNLYNEEFKVEQDAFLLKFINFIQVKRNSPRNEYFYL